MKEQQIPKAPDAEQSTLGAVLIEPKVVVEVADVLTAEMFWYPNNRVVFECMMYLHEAGIPLDTISVFEELRRRNAVENCGGVGYLHECIQSCPSALNVATYAQTVKEKYLLRRLLKSAERVTNLVYDGSEKSAAIIGEAELLFSETGRLLLTADPNRLGDLLVAQRTRIIAASESNHGAYGTPTGFYELDEITNGLQPNDLITLAAVPSMGKSALASQIAFNACKATNQPVIVFSLEMSKEQWIDRLVSGESRINGMTLRNGRMNDVEWGRMDDAHKRIESLPLFIVDKCAMSTQEMKAQARRLAAKHGTPALVAMDYIQIAEIEGKPESERLKVTQIARDLKNLARQLKCPVLALSQLSRGVNQRENKRPMLSDLRETSAIEAESDVVMFIYREAYYKQKQRNQWGADDTDNTAEIIVGKQRNGPTGTVNVAWIPELARFENLAK